MHQTKQQFDVGVIVGRFQTDTLHKGHHDLIQHVCDAHEKVIMFLGVSPLWATYNNPLDFQSRKQMIQAEFPDIIINYVEDMSSDEKWSAALDRQIGRLVSPAQTVVLYGSRDSFLPHYAGRYDTAELESDQVYSGTEERKRIASGNTRATADFRAGVIWATQARYPTAFPTVDIAILDETGQQLLLGRKPNEDRYRFVGGFVDPRDESLEAAARREATEETGLELGELRYVGSTLVDDWRYRGERDKIMTTLFVAKRVFGRPQPADDIADVKWFPLGGAGFGNPLVHEHRPLMDLLWNHVNKTAKGA